MDGIERFTHALAAYGQAVPKVPRLLAPFVVAKVQDHIRTLDDPPNAPLTLALKGRKGPLKDTGALRARIAYRIEPLTLIVGANGVQDRILNDGGEIRASGAKKLAIPATRQIKLAAEARGTRGYLAGLKAAGWRIWFSPKAIIGTAPRGAKGIGLKLKAKARPKAKSKTKRKRLPPRAHYLLFIRKDAVTIPARPYMLLERDEIQELRHMVRRILIRELT